MRMAESSRKVRLQPTYKSNPRRACTVRVTVLGLSVSQCVYVNSRTTDYKVAYERY